MEKQKLDDVHKKASSYLGAGMRILKGSLREARRLVGATADATRLHIEKESHVVGIHRDYHRLGVEVYNTLTSNLRRTQIDVSETMRDIAKRIKDSEKEIAASQVRLEHMSVVREEEKKVTPRVPPRKKRPTSTTTRAGSKR